VSTDNDTQHADGLSRRMLLTGGLAVAASAVASAVLPETAAANVGDTVHVGDDLAGRQTSFQVTSNGLLTGGSSLASSFIGRNANAFPTFPIQGLGSVIWSAAPAGSAAVWGDATAVGLYGVQATHDSDSGIALKVDGRASFSRSGQGTVAKNASSKSVTVASGVSTTSRILVTLQGDGGSGVYLKYAARTSATAFKVVLIKKAAKAVKFSWMIAD
jgi:hypothetical protein